MLDARRVKFRSRIVQVSIKRGTDAVSAIFYGAEDDVTDATSKISFLTAVCPIFYHRRTFPMTNRPGTSCRTVQSSIVFWTEMLDKMASIGLQAVFG